MRSVGDALGSAVGALTREGRDACDDLEDSCSESVNKTGLGGLSIERGDVRIGLNTFGAEVAEDLVGEDGGGSGRAVGFGDGGVWRDGGQTETAVGVEVERVRTE